MGVSGGVGAGASLHDPATGKDLEDYDEVHAAREEEKAAREAAEARAREAEEEAAELRAQLRRLRCEPDT